MASVPALPPPHKTADRPHWITILLGLTSPLLACVAVVISIRSVRTAQQAMRIGQRAYLKCQIQTSREENPAELKNRPDLISLKTVITVKNLGNTPAYVDSAKTVFGLFNVSKTGTVEQGGEHSIVPWQSTAIGPKDEIQPYVTAGPVPKLDQGGSGRPGAALGAGELHWHDVFGDEHVETWCEIVQFEPFMTNPCPPRTPR